MRAGAYLLPRDDLERAIALARRADEAGYESLWVTHGLGRDAFLVLAAYAQATRRTGLGTGVVPIYPRHPVAMAQEAATLAEISGGRFRLGIGVSHRPSMAEALGLDMGQPLDVMREYVAVVRAALGGRARFEGRYYRVAWDAAFRPPSPPPPLYLAGLSVPMLELAGELADGVVLWLCAPAYVRDVAGPALARGAQPQALAPASGDHRRGGRLHHRHRGDDRADHGADFPDVWPGEGRIPGDRGGRLARDLCRKGARLPRFRRHAG